MAWYWIVILTLTIYWIIGIVIGITTDEENVELEIDYNSIKKIADCSCEIEEDADDETD